MEICLKWGRVMLVLHFHITVLMYSSYHPPSGQYASLFFSITFKIRWYKTFMKRTALPPHILWGIFSQPSKHVKHVGFRFVRLFFFYSGASKCVVSTLNSKNVLYKALTLLIFYFLAFPPFKTVCGPLVLYFITAIGAKIMNCCKTD